MGPYNPVMFPEKPALVSLNVPVIPVISKVSAATAPDVLLPTTTAVIVPELVTVGLVKEKVKVSAFATADIRAAAKHTTPNLLNVNHSPYGLTRTAGRSISVIRISANSQCQSAKLANRR
jgi:hypothetical protein